MEWYLGRHLGYTGLKDAASRFARAVELATDPNIQIQRRLASVSDPNIRSQGELVAKSDPNVCDEVRFAPGLDLSIQNWVTTDLDAAPGIRCIVEFVSGLVRRDPRRFRSIQSCDFSIGIEFDQLPLTTK